MTEEIYIGWEREDFIEHIDKLETQIYELLKRLAKHEKQEGGR